jgi:hypothetical protein
MEFVENRTSALISLAPSTSIRDRLVTSIASFKDVTQRRRIVLVGALANRSSPQVDRSAAARSSTHNYRQ